MKDTVTITDVQPYNTDWPKDGRKGIYIGRVHGEDYGRYNFDDWDVDITFRRKKRVIKVGQKLRSNGLEATVVAIWSKAKDNDNRGVALQWSDSSLGLYSKREVQEFERIDE